MFEAPIETQELWDQFGQWAAAEYLRFLQARPVRVALYSIEPTITAFAVRHEAWRRHIGPLAHQWWRERGFRLTLPETGEPQVAPLFQGMVLEFSP